MIDTSKWEKIDRTGLSGEKIDRLIEACAMAHRDSYSIGLACESGAPSACWPKSAGTGRRKPSVT
jgi:hypothetical protein